MAKQRSDAPYQPAAPIMDMIALPATVGPDDDEAPQEAPAKRERLALWCYMEDAPRDRPIFISEDATTDDPGTLSYWRTTRTHRPGERGWVTICFWASLTTKRAINFEPDGWREAAGEAALAALRENQTVMAAMHAQNEDVAA